MGIGLLGLVLVVVDKILSGEAFERYRTHWLFELDYFSVAAIFLSIVVGAPALILYSKYREGKATKEIQRKLEESRNESD